MSLLYKFRNWKYLKRLHDIIIRLKYNSFPYPNEFKELPKKCVVFAPHPDDEIIGIGGIILKYSSHIDGIYIFTNKDNKTRVKESKIVSENLNIPYKFISNGNRIKEKDAIKAIKNIIFSKKPNVVCFPSFYETHVDHFLLFYLTINVLKEINYKGNILMYEVWNTLTPNYIVDISKEMNEKERLIKFYKSQIKDFDYVRFIKGLNIYRGMQINKKFGEGIIFLNFDNVKKWMF